MLLNLQIEMVKAKITHKEMATRIGMSIRAFSNKINEATAFTFPETIKIRDEFFPGLSLDYLFSSDCCLNSVAKRDGNQEKRRDE